MQSINFSQFLSSRWNSVYSSPDSKFIMRGDIQKVQVKKVGNIFVIYNQSLKKKRGSSVDDKKQNVFQQFDSSKFNFNKVTEKQILFYVNIDNEEIVTKEKAIENGSKFLDNDLEEADQQSENHPVIINTSPIFKNHALLVMFPESQLPQVVGQEVLLLILILFKLSPDLTIGFNSLGGAASVNHLHFHLLYTKNLIEKQKLPIQNFPRKLFHKTSLINPKQEINMYSAGVVIEQLIGLVKGFVLTPLDPKADQSQVFNSLAFVFGLFINEILDRNIPHNILVVEGGKTIFILPRGFATQKNQYAWLQMSGVAISKQEAEYQSFKEADWSKSVKELEIEPQKLQEIKVSVMAHLKQYS